MKINITKKKFISILFTGIILLGFIFILFPPSVHAQAGDPLMDATNRSTLSRSLRQGGGGPYEGSALTAWRVMLGLANVFVVAILMFLAVINILHINYDAYQIKKSLPNLIIGIVLANFSLVICRMFIDAANVLTRTIVGTDIANNILQPVVNNLGIAPIGGVVGTGALVALILGAGFSMGLILLLIILLLIPIIGVIIILFLLYIRIAVVLALASVSPLAFVAMGFPPTAGLFKQWWTQFLRWVFMKPIMLTILWLAALTGTPPAASTPSQPQSQLSLVTWLITVGLVYAAFIVPFKLGGAIMGAWGKLGKLIASPVTKVTKDALDKNKQAFTGSLKKGWESTGPGRWLQTRSAKMDELLETQKKAAEGRQAAAKGRISEKERGELALERNEAQNSLNEYEAITQEDLNKVEAGENFEGLSEEDYERLTSNRTAIGAAEKYMATTTRLNTAKETVQKRHSNDIIVQSMKDLRDHSAVTKQMADDLYKKDKKGNISIDRNGRQIRNANAVIGHEGISINEYDSAGNLAKAAHHDTMVTYAELLNKVSEFRAKAKGASTKAEQDSLNKVADEYQSNLTQYRTTQAGRYNYDAVLDRNTSGRRYKMLNPQIMDEADTTFKSSTGASIVDDLTKGAGTSEFRFTGKDMMAAVEGNWKEIEDTAAFGVSQHLQAVQRYIQLARSGDIEGETAMNGFMSYISTKTNRKKFKVNTIEASLERMEPAKKDVMLNKIADQMIHGSNWTKLTDEEKVKAMQSYDISKFTPTLQVDRNLKSSFVSGLTFEIHNDKNLGLGVSPGAPIAEANPNPQHHTH